MQVKLNIFFYKVFYTTYYINVYICFMTKITEAQQRRLDRNAKIKSRYESEVSGGGAKSAVIAGIAKSYRMTIPTVYSILKEGK